VGNVTRARKPGTVALLALAIALAAVTAGCGSSASGHVTATPAAQIVHWTEFVHAARPVDLAGPRPDGSLVLAANGRLSLLAGDRVIHGFAPAYRNSAGEEPYIDVAPKGCFGAGSAYALRLRKPKGVVRIGAHGGVRQFATVAAPGLLDGIAFDRTGRFGHRLLVTATAGSRTAVMAISCGGLVKTITRQAPRIEGGIAVAPAGFGRFAGDLIAPDEHGGGLYAITPSGQSILVGASGLPHGPDTGIESAGFVPAGSRFEAVLADRRTPGNPHPGDDFVLGLSHAALERAGVRAGDLLVASEGGAVTVGVRCGMSGCQIRHVADGPVVAHAEGHIAFLRLG
jgi:hypothetical protein